MLHNGTAWGPKRSGAPPGARSLLTLFFVNARPDTSAGGHVDPSLNEASRDGRAKRAAPVRNFLLEELADALDDRSGQFRYFFIVSSGRVEPYAADDPAERTRCPSILWKRMRLTR